MMYTTLSTRQKAPWLTCTAEALTTARLTKCNKKPPRPCRLYGQIYGPSHTPITTYIPHFTSVNKRFPPRTPVASLHYLFIALHKSHATPSHTMECYMPYHMLCATSGICLANTTSPSASHSPLATRQTHKPCATSQA